MLLLASGEIAAAAGEECLQDREQLKHQRIDVAVLGHPARKGLEPKQQVFPHGELGNDLPALGHIANPNPSPPMGR